MKNKYFSVENLENLEMRVYYRESDKSPIFVSENLLIFKFVSKVSESVSRDLMKFFRGTLKTGKKFTKKPWKTAKKLREKTLKPWNWEKIFGRHPVSLKRPT